MGDGRPRLVIETTAGELTPFNLVPTQLALSAPKLTVLTAVPWWQLGGSSPSAQWPPFTHFEFWLPESPFLATCPPGGVVFWPASTAGIALLERFDRDDLDRVVVVSGDDSLDAAIRSVATELPGLTTLLASEDRGRWGSFPRRIWTAVLEVAKARNPGAGTIAPPFISPLRDPGASRFSMDEWIAAAMEGRYLASVALSRRQSVSGDLLVRPNQMILAAARGEVPELDLTYVPEHPEQEAVELARLIVRARACNALLSQAVTEALRSGVVGLDAVVSAVGRRDPTFAASLHAALTADLRTEVGRAQMAEPLMSLPPWLQDLAPAQVVLVCPSTSIAIADRTEFQQRPTGGLRLEPYFDRADSYRDNLLRIVSETIGRRLKVPQPQTPEQAAVVQEVVATVKAEADWLSALSLLMAGRHRAPVLKTPRAPYALLERLRDPSDVLGRLEEGAANDWAAAAAAVQNVGTELAGVLPGPYISFLGELISPWIHCLSDVPMELSIFRGDYLAYQAAFSRTPTTPGVVGYRNYLATSVEARLPQPTDGFVIVTPFEPDDPLVTAMSSGLQGGPTPVPVTVINERRAFLDALEDRR